MNCHYCKAECDGSIKSAPVRHGVSPNPINRIGPHYYNYYCSVEHRELQNKITYACLAEIDRNASDSECFDHVGWDGNMRLGKCKVTGEDIGVEPLQPGDNSGQPKSCYEHFVLKKQYQDILDKL